MFAGYKISLVTFVGRRRSLNLLARYVQPYRDLIDEWILGWNVRDPHDEHHIRVLHEGLHPWTRLITKRGGDWDFAEFYAHFRDPQTLYVKVDDDIVWMEEGALTRLVEFRIANVEFSLVSANVINNPLMTHLHQRFGMLEMAKRSGWNWGDDVGLRDGAWAEHIHRRLLESVRSGDLSGWKFNRFILYPGERFSINCICFFGTDVAMVDVAGDDEHYLTVEMPRILRRPTAFCGNSLMAHLSFGPQARYIGSTDVLNQYEILAGVEPPKR